MALQIRLTTNGMTLSPTEQMRIERQLQKLNEQELANRPEPQAAVVLRQHASQRQVDVDLRIQLGPLGRHVVSHQTAATPDQAVRLAVDDLKRQLERLRAAQAGESTYGVPSRRLPKQLRPHPPGSASSASPDEGWPPTDE